MKAETPEIEVGNQRSHHHLHRKLRKESMAPGPLAWVAR